MSSSEWTVPYDALQFDCSLGSGAFGTVRKAYLMTGVGCKTAVAVKSLQCNVAIVILFLYLYLHYQVVTVGSALRKHLRKK